MRRTPGDVETSAGPTRFRAARSGAASARMLEEARDALELAIVSGAPSELVDRLALVTGLLNAIADLASDSPPLTALTATTVERGRTALDAWRTWQRGMLPRTG